jgi:hypothetical protein
MHVLHVGFQNTCVIQEQNGRELSSGWLPTAAALCVVPAIVHIDAFLEKEMSMLRGFKA